MTQQDSTFRIPLPQSTDALVRTFLDKTDKGHPGLILDKYAATWNNQDTSQGFGAGQKQVLQDVVKHAETERPRFAIYLKTWNTCLKALDAKIFKATTRNPLTLHLSRASALENAGIYLHHVHGFPYLPGSGLKGLARAYALTRWLPAQKDPAAAAQRINDIFGPETQNAGAAGSVVFHDAWPARSANLYIDVLCCHHSQYYSSKGKKLPGDWEDPVPVYFLGVKEGTEFCFALSARKGLPVQDVWLEQAMGFLKGGLQYMGAGAKTSAGYGLFRIPDTRDAPPATKEPLCGTFPVTLTSPAFLAGALQKEDDCRLRAATLRGMLRWWWRTMHAGHVDGESLAQMEAAIWGSSNRGSAVTVDVTQPKVPIPRRAIIRSDQDLLYWAYGMDNITRGQRTQRCYIDAGVQWEISLHARSLDMLWEERLQKIPVQVHDVLDQARTALELLCTFGGIGSKSRHGFGSLQLAGMRPAQDVMTKAIETGEDFRKKFFPEEKRLIPAEPHTASLDHCLPVQEYQFSNDINIWSAMRVLGAATQGFASSTTESKTKTALGLPRMSKGKSLRDKDGHKRHASPVHFHFEKKEEGLVLRVLAFPCPWLPDYETSKGILQNLLNFLKNKLEETAPKIQQSQQHQIAAAPDALSEKRKRNYGERVQVRILAARSKGGYDVQEEGRKQGILALGDPPVEVEIGKLYDVYIHDDAPRPQYRWNLPPKKEGKSVQGKRRSF